MMLDIAQLVTEMKDAASQALSQDITTVQGFSDRQIAAIAQQAAFVEAGIASGQITSETQEFFLNSLGDMALNFAKTLRGLVMVTIEKVWNAIVGVIWKAISTAVGVQLPTPTH